MTGTMSFLYFAPVLMLPLLKQFLVAFAAVVPIDFLPDLKSGQFGFSNGVGSDSAIILKKLFPFS
jgi:hypothetical protein